MSHYLGMATKIDTPDVKQASLAEVSDPPAAADAFQQQIHDLGPYASKKRSISRLQNSKVMRTLGGRFSTHRRHAPQVAIPRPSC